MNGTAFLTKSRLAILALLAVPAAHAGDKTLVAPAPPPTIAFARYIASLRTRDSFQQPGFTALRIEAALPELYKEAAVVAIRRRDPSGVSTYAPLELVGDGSVLTEVVDRYFELERALAASPDGERISPHKYAFRFDGEVKTGPGSAFVFRVAPKKRGPTSFRGKIWIDPESGAPILFNGQVGQGKHTQAMNVVRDIRIMNGVAIARVDHVSFALPQLGRAEVVVTELLLQNGTPLAEPFEKSSVNRQLLPRVPPSGDFY